MPVPELPVPLPDSSEASLCQDQSGEQLFGMVLNCRDSLLGHDASCFENTSAKASCFENLNI